MQLRRFGLLAIVLTCGSAVALACSSFGSDEGAPRPGADDSGSDGMAGDGAVPGEVDGSSVVDARADSPCGDTATDPKNCGKCGRVCEGTCTAGLCDPFPFAGASVHINLKQHLALSHRIVVAGADVYWADVGAEDNDVNKAGGGIWHCVAPAPGKQCAAMRRAPGERVVSIAVDVSRIHYAANDAAGWIERTGTAVGLYVTNLPAGTPLADVAVTPTNVFLAANNHGILSCAPGGSAPCPPVTPASTEARLVAAEGSALCFAGMVLNGSVLDEGVFCEGATGFARVAQPLGGDPLPAVLTLGGPRIYFDGLEGARSVDISGGDAGAAFGMGTAPRAISVLNDKVFFAVSSDLYACPTSGCSPTTRRLIAHSEYAITAVHATPTYVYFATGGGADVASVFRVPPPQ